MMPGLLPNLKIFPEFMVISLVLPATTEFYCAATISGGTINFAIGYKIAARVETALKPSR